MRGLPFRATTDDIYRVPRRSNPCHTAPTPGKTPGQPATPATRLYSHAPRALAQYTGFFLGLQISRLGLGLGVELG